MSRWWFSFLVGLLIFLIPSNLFLAFPSGTEYVGGLRVDYLIPKLYLSDCVMLTILASFLLWKRRTVRSAIKKHLLVIGRDRSIAVALLIIFLFIIRQLYATEPVISMVTMARLGLSITLMLVLMQLTTLVKKSHLVLALTLTISFQSVIALYQWLTQSSVYSYLLLGEPSLQFPLGLAKTVWQGREMILPYGTTAHPNLLGGFLAVAVVAVALLTWSLKAKVLQRWVIVAVAVTGVCTLLLTHSISAGVALAVGLSLLLYNYYSRKNHALSYVKASNFLILLMILSLLSLMTLTVASNFLPKNDSIIRRTRLDFAAIELFLRHPIRGTGLTNFTIGLDQSLSREKEIVPFLQPAHNVFLLSLAEVGLLGIAALFSLRHLLRATKLSDRRLGWFSSRLPAVLIMLLPLAILDHYLISLQSGVLVLVVTPFLFQETS